MTDDEKRELLETIRDWARGFAQNYPWTEHDKAILKELQISIEQDRPKYTMCENCLDDLEDVKPCPKCDGLGYIEIDEPGDRYATRIYCDQCQVGYDLLKHDEDKYWEHINSKIDRKEGK
jgi:hypothetical protein